MKKVRFTIPERYQHLRSQVRMHAESARMEKLDESRKLEVSYDVNPKDFTCIDVDDLQSLQDKGVHGLDMLYRRKGVLRLREF